MKIKLVKNGVFPITQAVDGSPLDDTPNTSYPLLLDVYGGPGSQGVYNTFETSGWHQGAPYVTLADMFKHLDVPVTQHGQMTQGITDCMKRMGCKPKRIKENGSPKRVWMKS